MTSWIPDCGARSAVEPGQMSSRIGLGVLVLAVALAACSGGHPCDANYCQGCCDTRGVCHVPERDFCGNGGISCQACGAAQSCVIGTCVAGAGGGAGGSGGGTSGT